MLAWREQDINLKDWLTITLRRMAWNLTTLPSTDRVVLNHIQRTMLPPEDTLQQAMIYFQKRRAVARECANPQCKVGRFFFASRPRQVYCSTSCSNEMAKAKKLRWWNETGSKRRSELSRRIARDAAK